MHMGTALVHGVEGIGYIDSVGSLGHIMFNLDDTVSGYQRKQSSSPWRAVIETTKWFTNCWMGKGMDGCNENPGMLLWLLGALSAGTMDPITWILLRVKMDWMELTKGVYIHGWYYDTQINAIMDEGCLRRQQQRIQWHNYPFCLYVIHPCLIQFSMLVPLS